MSGSGSFHDGADQELFVPDRFEALRERGSLKLQAIVSPVSESLRLLDRRFAEMRASSRGSLLLLRGDSGSGKSTFLDTVHLFRNEVTTYRIPFASSIAEGLASLTPVDQPRIVVIEGREALGTVSGQAIEEGLHAVNSFLRSPSGIHTLLVWPVNMGTLAEQLADTAAALGGEALIGSGSPVEEFTGPPRTDFVAIAERTVGALNEGASLAALGISASRAEELLDGAKTIGTYLGRVRNELLGNGQYVKSLVAAERCRVWTVVIAGNEPEGDVAALTRGGYAYCDVDRLMTATGANIVADLKKHPEQLGILGTVLDARIVHIDMVTALAVCRTFGDGTLHGLMQAKGMTTKKDDSAIERVNASELGILLRGDTLGTRKRGPKPGPNTTSAFHNLAEIARENDTACNRALGSALLATGLIDSFKPEQDIGKGVDSAHRPPLPEAW